MFSEYFLSISIIYVLIISVIITSNVYNCLLQNVFSNCVALILLMAGYLIFNDDLFINNFISFNNSIVNDYFSYVTKIVICLFSSCYCIFIANVLGEQKIISFEYLLLILFSVFGFLLMCCSNDLLTAYLAIELSAFSLYMLACFKKKSSFSIDSGIKYFITGAVSSTFYLVGSSFIYGFTGSVNFLDFYDLFDCSNNYILTINFYDVWNFKQNKFLEAINIQTINFIDFGLTFIILSLFIKLALAPFHLWSLDVYEGSPTSSTFFFAVIAKLSIFVLLTRICFQSFLNLKNFWQFYSLLVGVLSIFIGSFGGLNQRKLKTLLAYSTINHMGYVLISFSTGTYIGIQMLLFYFFFYKISGLCIWYSLSLIKLKKQFQNKYSKQLNDLILMKKSNTGLAFCISIAMFSIAGIPPLIGFLAKITVFLSIIGISFYFVALISLVCSIVSTFYYIRIVKILYFENLLTGNLYYPIKTKKTIILSFLIFLLLYLFSNPSLLYLISLKTVLHFF